MAILTPLFEGFPAESMLIGAAGMKAHATDYDRSLIGSTDDRSLNSQPIPITSQK